MNKEDKRMLIRRWGAYARWPRTQKTAYRLWEQVRPLLTKKQADRLLIVWAQAGGDDGSRALDREVRRLAGTGNVLRRKRR